MGCDGGTIPKRNEIVKNKQKDQSRDKNADLAAKWQFCSLSGLKLKKPIVTCHLGQLYNKDAIIKHLLELRTSTPSKQATSSTSSVAVSHIKSLKDVTELKLKERDDFDNSYQAKKGNEQFKAQFLCPITGLELNGKYKFYCLLKCGCVLSDRALKQVVPNEKKCLVCTKPYDPNLDLIVLNGDNDEVEELKEKIKDRRRGTTNLKRSRREEEQQQHMASGSRRKESNYPNVDSTSKRLKTEPVR